MSEVWMPIPGYEGLYDASSLGRIRSHHRGGKIKVPSLTSDGYLLAFLHSDNGRRGHNVHRLVCMAFHGLPSVPSMEAAHLDGDRLNNVPGNLAWATRAQNIAHKLAHGTTRPGEQSVLAKLSETQVKECWLSPASARVLGEKFGVSAAAVEDIRSGQNWRHLTRHLSPQPNRPRSSPKPVPQGFAEAASDKPHWSVLAARFGMSKATVFKNLAKLRAADAPNPHRKDFPHNV